MPAPSSPTSKPRHNKPVNHGIWDATYSIFDAEDSPKYIVWGLVQHKHVHPQTGIDHLSAVLIGRKEEQKLSCIADRAELAKNDHNLSPSRYIHTSKAQEYHPFAKIVAEQDTLEADARETDKPLRKILKQLGV